MNMESYMNSLAFKRTTLCLIASRIPEDQIEMLRNVFTKIDKNGDGQLTIEELAAGVKDIPGINLNVDDLVQAMEVIDSNQNGLIDYTEFIAACMNSYSYLKENHLRSAFTYFDKDGNGRITKAELRQCLTSEDFTLNEEQVEHMLLGVDANDDGEIDYEEFIDMMIGPTDNKHH